MPSVERWEYWSTTSITFGFGRLAYVARASCPCPIRAKMAIPQFIPAVRDCRYK